MIKTKEQLSQLKAKNEKGDIKLYLSDLTEFDSKNPKLEAFTFAELTPGEEAEYHIHEGECEYYYIVSGKGLYNDNGKEIEVFPGTITYTPSGCGHGIKNIGEEMLEFITLILKD